MKFVGAHIFDYDATFRGDVTIEGNLTVSNSVSQTISFGDNDKLKFGDGNDLEIYHDASNSYIDQVGTGDLILRNTTDDKDIIFQSDDGSGGVETYFFLDGNAGGANPTTIFPDNSRLAIGSGQDLKLYHSPSISYIEANNELRIRQTQDDGDILFQSDDGSGGITTYMQLDGSHKRVVFPNDVQATFGSSSRLSIKHDGTDATILESQGDLKIINTADDKDIIFQSDDGSGGATDYIRLDGSAERTIFSKSIVLSDSVEAIFGTGLDFKIKHTSVNTELENNTGNLTFINNADDKDIKFFCDDGSGGTTAYITLDGSETEIHLHKTVGIGTTNPDTNYKLDVAGKVQVQGVLELDDVLTLNAISTPADPASNQASIYMDSADGAIKAKIRVGDTVVTRTLATFE